LVTWLPLKPAASATGKIPSPIEKAVPLNEYFATAALREPHKKLISAQGAPTLPGRIWIVGGMTAAKSK
jgi:hypothetical protein